MRLIDADRALEIVRDQGIAHPNAYHLTNYTTLILREAPTIEAEPIRHGRWIKRPDERICPFCNDRHSYFGGKDKNYCPNCGARMDEEAQ